MKRITRYNGIWTIDTSTGADKYTAISKPAEYENTDLDPEEIEDIKAEKEYWKREAIKNAAELGELKMKLYEFIQSNQN